MGVSGRRGKLIEIDLTAHRVQAIASPPEDIQRTWIGGLGLGLYFLAKEITPGMTTTDPDAPCFLMNGPLTGTDAPNSANWTIVNVRCKPHYVTGVSHAHGYFGARLAHAGWDGIIIRGAAQAPVYLWIDDDRVELRDASPYWGEDTYETPRRIKLDLGDSQNISVACIGPGGENLLLGSTVRGDGTYTCAMGDAGSAWGSKKLKAIAVRGSGRPLVADMATFTEGCNKWNHILRHGPIPLSERNASFRGIAAWGAFGGIPVKNFTEPESAAAWCNSLKNDSEKWNVEAIGSWQCEMACHHRTTVTTGPLAGTVASGFGPEVFEEVGPNMGIYDAGTSMALAGFVDGLGIHSGEIPRTIATMMEAYNAGRLTLKDTDGIDLAWGNHEAVIAMLQKAVHREGIGALIAQGMEATSKQLEIEDLAVHMRGVGFQGHDFRFHPAAVFAKQVVTGIGPSPQTTTGLYKLSSDEVLPRDKKQGIGVPMLHDQCKKLWIDCIGVCTRAFENRPATLECAVTALAGLKGWSDFTREEALTAGERIINLQRLISLSRGFNPEFDFHMSERMLSIPSGPAKDKALPLGPYLRKWRDEYYQAAGWNIEDGKPLPETLERLGLSEFKVGEQSE